MSLVLGLLIVGVIVAVSCRRAPRLRADHRRIARLEYELFGEFAGDIDQKTKAEWVAAYRDRLIFG